MENFLTTLESLMEARLNAKEPLEDSYIWRLSQKRDGVLQKFGEEAVEFLLAAKNEDLSHTKEEAADCFFFFLLALKQKGLSLKEIVNILEARHKARISSSSHHERKKEV